MLEQRQHRRSGAILELRAGEDEVLAELRPAHRRPASPSSSTTARPSPPMAIRCRRCAGTPTPIRCHARRGRPDRPRAVRGPRRQGRRSGPGRRRSHHPGRVPGRARHRRAHVAADGRQSRAGRRDRGGHPAPRCRPAAWASCSRCWRSARPIFRRRRRSARTLPHAEARHRRPSRRCRTPAGIRHGFFTRHGGVSRGHLRQPQLRRSAPRTIRRRCREPRPRRPHPRRRTAFSPRTRCTARRPSSSTAAWSRERAAAGPTPWSRPHPASRSAC